MIEGSMLLYVSKQLGYLLASLIFIVGIRKLNRIREARKGNALSSLGMLLAIIITVTYVELLSLVEVGLAMIVGGFIGLVVSRKVKMTKIPEMVALFNGFGGISSALVAMSEYWSKELELYVGIDSITYTAVSLSIIIGMVTFTGSLIAFMKLSGLGIGSHAIVFRGQHFLNGLLLIVLVSLPILIWRGAIEGIPSSYVMVGFVLLAAILGVFLVIPIGGADMPVVISLLNSYSGMAACATGFVLGNIVLVVTGSLVGASGIILTNIMCKAMNRSLLNVLLGGFGSVAGVDTKTEGGNQIAIKKVEAVEASMMLDGAGSVIVVPGYGLAVSQAQHVVRELVDQLEKKDILVRFAIHPVAGRMPGHMNVLLAEANIPYDKMLEMDKINDDFSNTDISLVIGANDVVNPSARTNKNSPIYGMPILNVDKSRTVIVCKRSMATGYSGVDNELFGVDNCLMLFGDAKVSIATIVSELKDSA